ncbi:MAG: hypothetical protein CMH52_06690 [Myxococcales bacterium]|nr:hypothetical protein [Myxococcales bacterium]
MDVSKRKVETSMQRISSGKRINATRDDAAGSQVSESLTTQVKGASRAARNAYDGANLARTAEAALGTVSNILHEMRSIAVQAANDTLVDADRASLQLGIQAFIDEVEHIGTSTNFANIALLDGTFLNQGMHIGSGYKEAPLVSIEDTRAKYLGRFAVAQTDRMNEHGLETGDLRINDVRIRATVEQDDRLSTTQRRASSIAKVAAINDAFTRSRVNAFVNRNDFVATGDVVGGTLNNENFLSINDQVISGYDISADDADETLMGAINHLADKTGVVAHFNADRRLVLTAEDGRNIHIKTVGNAGQITGVMAASGSLVTRGTMTILSDDLFKITDPSNAQGEFKIGVNEDDIIGLNELDVLATADVSTVQGANRTLSIIDRVNEAVIHSRGKLGGLENRLEFTVSRLNKMAQHAYSARSKVRDADIAKESAVMVKNNIVQTTFTNVLAQANQQSFRVLQLL